VDSPGLREDPRYAALFDPQTSGGLLIGLAPEGNLPASGFGGGCVVVGEITAADESPSITLVGP
jgi:hypothetical protein